MSRAAKATLFGSLVLSCGIIWGVHFLQRQEADTMYQGVVRDDERRREKRRLREQELKENIERRAIFEAVQRVTPRTDLDQAAVEAKT